MSTSNNSIDPKTALEKFLQDKAIRSSEDFSSSKQKKTSGVSTGYNVTDKTTGTTNLIKTANKNIATNDRGRNIDDKRDLTTEYVLGSLWQRYLYDRAPQIGLVTLGQELKQDPTSKIVKLSKDETQGKIALRSKFFSNFSTISQFSGDDVTTAGGINSQAFQLKELEGFEKVIAASLFMGEIDYHAGNLGVVKGEDGQNIVVKIDHGRSGNFSESDHVDSVISGMINRFNDFKYGKIPFDPKKFNESIKEMLKVSDDEIENFIQKRASELKAIGADADDKMISSFVENIQKRKSVMKEYSARLDIIENLRPEIQQNWLHTIGAQDPLVWAARCGEKINGKDPIAWAIEHGKTIDGKNPKEWVDHRKNDPQALLDAAKYGEKIDSKDAIVWAHEQGKMIDGKKPEEWAEFRKNDPQALLDAAKKGEKIDGKSVIIWALENRKKLGGSDPIAWAYWHNKQIDGVDALIWAHDNGNMIDGQPALLYANANDMIIEGKHALVWAAANNILIEGKNPIIWAIDNDIQIDNSHPIAAASGKIKIEGKDPIIFASDKKLLIEETEPLVFACKNGYSIEGVRPIIWHAEQGRKIEDQDPIAWAVENKKTIHSATPILWAVDNGYKIDNRFDPIAWCARNGKDIVVESKLVNPIVWAVENGKKIDGVEAIAWAIKNDEKIEGKDPIAWAVIKGKGIGDQSLSPADYCKSIDIDMLPHLASEYKRGTSEQDTEMNKAYEGYRGNQVIPTPAIDALLQGNPKTVARLINKLSKSGKDTSISLEAITNNCSLDTLYKMAQIGDQIEERAKTNKITKFFYDQLDKFTNSIKKSDNVKNSKIKAALIELSNMQSLTRSKEVKKDKLHNIIKELAQKTPARASQTSIKPTHPKSLTI